MQQHPLVTPRPSLPCHRHWRETTPVQEDCPQQQTLFTLGGCPSPLTSSGCTTHTPGAARHGGCLEADSLPSKPPTTHSLITHHTHQVEPLISDLPSGTWPIQTHHHQFPSWGWGGVSLQAFSLSPVLAVPHTSNPLFSLYLSPWLSLPPPLSPLPPPLCSLQSILT